MSSISINQILNAIQKLALSKDFEQYSLTKLKSFTYIIRGIRALHAKEIAMCSFLFLLVDVHAFSLIVRNIQNSIKTIIFRREQMNCSRLFLRIFYV